MSQPLPAAAPARAWIVSPAWDLTYVVLTPLAIVPAVLVVAQRWLSVEQVYLAVISFASLGHHLPGFVRAYGERDLFLRYRWRFLLAPPLVFALALVFTPPPELARALGIPWTNLHGLELILAVWGAWHGLMQTYGFMRIYDVRRGEQDRATARLDHALCVAIFVGGVIFSDVRIFGLARAMWQAGLPLFGPEALRLCRWGVGAAGAVVLALYLANMLRRQRQGIAVNGVKLALAAVTGWFWWYCGRLSTNLLIGVAMFEIYHAVQYNAIVWVYNRRLLARAGEKFGPLGFLFRDRTTMLGIYLGAIAAYSAVRFFTAQPNDRMFSGDLASAHQWLIAAFVASSLLHFYYDGFIWKVSESRTRETLAAAAPAASSTLASQLHTPALVHGAKWATLAAIAAVLIAAERQYDGKPRAVRDAQQRAALIALTPGVPEAAMLASQDASARGDKAKAVAQARLAARARPGSHRSQAELAWALLEVQEYAEARRAIEAALAIAPDSWDYQCDLGEICERLGDDEDAEAAYRRALQLGAQEREPWLRWSDFLLRRTRTEEAAAAVDSLLALDPQGAEGSYRLGLVQLHRGDPRAAVAPLRRAVAKDPRHFQAWLQLGDALMALGKSEPAARAYQRAVELRPEVSVAWVCWADSLLQSGLTGEAETTLRSGLAATPDSPELCLTLGLLLQQSGRAEEAAHLLRRAEELGLRVPAEQSEVDRADR